MQLRRRQTVPQQCLTHKALCCRYAFYAQTHSSAVQLVTSDSLLQDKLLVPQVPLGDYMAGSCCIPAQGLAQVLGVAAKDTQGVAAAGTWTPLVRFNAAALDKRWCSNSINPFRPASFGDDTAAARSGLPSLLLPGVTTAADVATLEELPGSGRGLDAYAIAKGWRPVAPAPKGSLWPTSVLQLRGELEACEVQAHRDQVHTSDVVLW